MQRLIVAAETVLPISSSPIKRGAVLVVDGKIKEIGHAKYIQNKHSNIKTLNLGRGILLPGFVNAHVHLELGWVRTEMSEPETFISWLKQIIKAKMEGGTKEEIEASVRQGTDSLIKSGVTTIGEISSYNGSDKPSLIGSGVRAVLFTELYDRHDEARDFLNFEKHDLFEERPFPHAPYSCSADFLTSVSKLCRDRAIPLGIHLAESPDEAKFLRGEENGFQKEIFPLIGRETPPPRRAKTPFQYLKRLGFFDGTKATLVHMVQVLPEEVEEILKFDLGIVLCPRSNFYLKVGLPPVKLYAKLGRIGIGTDGLSSNLNLDFFEELRFFYLTFSESLGELASYFTVYLATLGGAKSLYLEDRIGSIEEGKEADLIFLSSHNPPKNPYLSVISSEKEDVKLVMVRGKIIYSKNG